jgi:tripartite-type tricarboxylate transporter receptor subunit TctC
MNMRRRRFLGLAANAAAFSIISGNSWAQAYPTRPVRLIVGFPAGGTTDIVARLIGQRLSDRLGQQFVIDNRPGANTTLALEAVARAPADGYTIGTVGPSNAINSTLYQKLNVDLNRDLVMVAGMNNSPLVLEVHPSVPVNTVPEFIAYAKANPTKISLASFGTGSISHVAGELFKIAAGLDLLHIPYRGSAPMLIDLLGERVQAAFDNLPASIEHIRSGRLRPLAVTTALRSEALPQIPALGESLSGYEASAYLGICAPKATPGHIVTKLNDEINAALADPKIKARLVELGGAPFVLSSADFGNFVINETEKWRKVIRAAKIKAE